MNGRAARGLERFQSLPRHRRIAALVSLVWVIVVVSYAIGFLGSEGPAARGTLFIDGLFFLVALALPLLLVWIAARFAEELAYQREMIAALAELTPPLIEALHAGRETMERHGPASPQAIEAAVRHGLAATSAGRSEIDLRPALSGLTAAQGRTEALLAQLLEAITAPPPAPAAPPPEREPEPAPKGRRAASRKRAEEPPQPDLPLLAEPAEAAAEPEPAPSPRESDERLNWPILVRALNFPRDPEDHEGFRALKIALRHHSVAQMLQAAEDVLTLLAQRDVFVDDLTVEAADPEAWRRFIAGERGAGVDQVGGVRDAKALEIAGGLMKSDAIFGDAALFFHRRFDAVLTEFAHDARDDQLIELADTRSARAFMLLARLNGAFG